MTSRRRAVASVVGIDANTTLFVEAHATLRGRGRRHCYAVGFECEHDDDLACARFSVRRLPYTLEATGGRLFELKADAPITCGAAATRLIGANVYDYYGAETCDEECAQYSEQTAF